MSGRERKIARTLDCGRSSCVADSNREDDCVMVPLDMLTWVDERLSNCSNMLLLCFPLQPSGSQKSTLRFGGAGDGDGGGARDDKGIERGLALLVRPPNLTSSSAKTLGSTRLASWKAENHMASRPTTRLGNLANLDLDAD